jgi:hypothetical protein
VGSVSPHNRSQVDIELPPSVVPFLRPHPLHPDRPLVVTGVRYGWGDWPVCSLFQADAALGLPVLPFIFEWPEAGTEQPPATAQQKQIDVKVERPSDEEPVPPPAQHTAAWALATCGLVGMMVWSCWRRWRTSHHGSKGKTI